MKIFFSFFANEYEIKKFIRPAHCRCLY